MELKNYTQFVNEGKNKKGIHPAVRSHLIAFFKKNKEGSFAEAQKFIKSKMKTWKLSKEDYNEAKTMNESMTSNMSLKEKMLLAYEQMGEILDMVESGNQLPSGYEDKAHQICNDISVLYSTVTDMEEEESLEDMEGVENIQDSDFYAAEDGDGVYDDEDEFY
jgi:hypothetical protein